MEQGRASVTAQRVAAMRLTMDRAVAPYGSPHLDEALSRDVAGDVGEVASTMSRYLAARTAFFDRVVVAAIDAGVRDVVVLAAGYDGRSLRYSHPEVTWFEVDHPATQRDKRERLTRLGIETDGVRFVAADFTVDDTGAALVAAGLRDGAPALVLCEGLAVYLPEDVLFGLMGTVRAVVAPASPLAISLSTEAPAADADDHEERSRRFRAAVHRVGEPVRSRVTVDEAAARFPSYGWEFDRRSVAGCAVFRAVEPSAVRP